MTRGQNIFEDLIADSQEMITSVLVSANQPLDPLRHSMLSTAIDNMLDTVSKVIDARPGLGEQFDIYMDAPDRSEKPSNLETRLSLDEDIIDSLEQRGYFDQFNPVARERVRDALAALDGATFETVVYKGFPAMPVGLTDLIAVTVQRAITGNSETPWEME